MKKVLKILYVLLLAIFFICICFLLAFRFNATGATIDENQKHNAIVDGKIDINRASPDELCQLPGIGPAIADKIINYRNINSSFKSTRELLYIDGISKKMYEELKEYVTVGG